MSAGNGRRKRKIKREIEQEVQDGELDIHRQIRQFSIHVFLDTMAKAAAQSRSVRKQLEADLDLTSTSAFD